MTVGADSVIGEIVDGSAAGGGVGAAAEDSGATGDSNC